MGMLALLDLLKRLYTSLSFYLGYPLVLIKAMFSSPSVGHTAKQEILNIVGFQEGKTFVRYLGTYRALSYAGRVQLINSILFSMQAYWISTFFLIIKRLNKRKKMRAATLSTRGIPQETTRKQKLNLLKDPSTKPNLKITSRKYKVKIKPATIYNQPGDILATRDTPSQLADATRRLHQAQEENA